MTIKQKFAKSVKGITTLRKRITQVTTVLRSILKENDAIDRWDRRLVLVTHADRLESSFAVRKQAILGAISL